MVPCEVIAPLFWDIANAAAEIYIKAAGKSALWVVGVGVLFVVLCVTTLLEFVISI